MKPFLSIRSNLLLMNVVVIGLILWLTISFLFVAVTQKLDAQQLQTNVDTLRVIFKANEALAYERKTFDYHLTSHETSLAQYYQMSQSAGNESDARLNEMTDQVTHQITDFYFFDHLPTTPAVLRKQLTALERHRTQLAVYRNYSLSQFLLPSQARDRDISSVLYSNQTDIIEDLVDLASSLKYLPDANASAIATYQALHNEVLLTHVALARKNTALNSLMSGNITTSPAARVQITVLRKTIERRLAEIVSLARASDNSAQLLPLAKQAQRFYLKEHLWAESTIQSRTESQEHSEADQALLHSVASSLSKLTGSLADGALASIDVVADNYGTRANRNLMIDVVLVLLCFAITAASLAINRRLKRYAYYDNLTQLPNRMNFESTLQSASVSGSRMQAVIFIDLDRFKSINDNYGHSMGDELLVKVAARLQETCKQTHLVARMGGDEFAVFVPDAPSAESVEALAAQLAATVKRNIMIRGLSLKVGASVGISLSPDDCECGIELLTNADIAMYYSKTHKLDSAFRFNQAMANDYRQRLKLEIDLKKGLESGELKLVYQPKVCTQSGQVKSVEALLRWVHPERGFVSPDQFIPIAEDIGLMGTIGHWVLNKACREIAQLHIDTHSQLRVAVNISTQQFCDEQFVDNVLSALSTHGLEHNRLELEVTESLVMTDILRVISVLKHLKHSGITIAIDDFGTGYSSLQYLQELPLDTLKIDRAFIVALDNDDAANSVANSIVQLAKLFDLETVAEGVETLEQDQKTRSLGVHHIQGYLYSKPVPVDELAAAIKQIEGQHGSEQQRAA